MEIFCGSKTCHDIFPYLSQDQECGQWIQHWIMISGLFFTSTVLLWLWGVCQTRGSLPRCLLRACCVEGLLLDCEELAIHKGSPWRVACPVQFNMAVMKEGLVVQPGEGHPSAPAGLPFDFSKKKKKSVFSRKIAKTQPRPPPVARCSEGGRLLCKRWHTKVDKQSPCKVQMGPMLPFLLANGCVCPGFYSFLSLGLWEKKEKWRCHKTSGRELPRMVPVERFRAYSL